jgi:hypothetical protein
MVKLRVTMTNFKAIHIQHSQTGKDEGWAVQRSDSDGLKIVVTRFYDTEQEALDEAARLTREASRWFMQ